MATFLAIQSAIAPALAAIPSVALQRPTTTGVSATSAADRADSTVVTLSNAARVLSTIGSTADVANTAFVAAPSNGMTSPPLTGNDIVASERRTSDASLALQALLDDPSLRAVKNLADPLYSALIAASHLSDFVPAALAGVNLRTLAADAPAPVTPVAVSRAIDFYRETAGETGRLITA